MAWVTFFEKLNKISVGLLLLLIPVFFLPFTSNVLDFPKEVLVLTLVPLSLIGLLGKRIFEGRLVLRKNKILYSGLILIFLSIFISSVFSLSPNASFFNYSADITDNFPLLLMFLVLVFVIVNSFERGTEFFPFLFLFIVSGSVAGLINILQVYKIFIFSFDFARTSSFNTVGTTNSFAVLAAALLPLSLILAFKAKGRFKMILGAVSFILFLNVVLINFKIAWISITAGILVLFILGFKAQRKIGLKWLIFLMAGLVFSVFFYFFPLSLSGFPVLSPEVSLNSASEFYIIKGAFNEGIKNVILGTGPGTFVFDYSQYHSPLLNQTAFWGTRFLNGNSAVFDWFLTKGILGGISLLLFYSFIIYFFIGHLKKDKDAEDDSEIKLALIAGIAVLIVASFLYPFNLVLQFALWFLIGGFFLFFSPLVTVNFSSPSKIILVNSVFIIIIILTLSLFFLQGQKYFAEARYLKGIEASQSGNFDEAINYISGAARLNSSIDVYWRDLSQLYLAKTNLVSQDGALSLEEKRSLTNLAVVSGADAISRAIALSPMNVANWNVRGFFYRNLMSIPGSEEIALSSYKKAAELEPVSPFVFGEIGRVYILIAQNFSQKESQAREQNLDLAIENLDKAISLKPDYAPAHYLLAVVYDQQEETSRAISKLEETKIIAPQDPGVAFQLGLLYWRTKEFDNAKLEFERAVNLNSSYSNAIYMLGLAYDKEGNKEKARQQFEELIKLNQQNQQVKDILENLKNELPALYGIGSSELPAEELQPAIQN